VLTILAVALLAVCGFAFLAWTMLAVWRSLGNRKHSLFSSPVKGEYIEDPVSREDCYDDCMKKSGWDSAKVRSCVAECNL
jgi:hypothetical protein